MGAPPEPQRFGKYQILERISAGAMAEIFKARLDGIGGFSRTFAIKRILPQLTRNQEFIERLVEEAKVAGLLSHANIVQILDLGNIDEHYFIAMEYVNGRDLARITGRCREKGITLPVPHAVFVVIEILKALDYAHNRQVLRGGRTVPLHIVHRDISPANVLISFQGEVKLTDFGIARAAFSATPPGPGGLKGRLDYMSPEQVRGEAADQRSDLYSVGVVLYELLTGRHPFRRASPEATLEAIKAGNFDLPSDVNPDVPPSLDEVVSRALSPNLGDRFATAAQFKESLDRFFHDSGFIFSASTLAAFVRGLFPEADPRARPKAPPEDDTRLLEEIELDEEEPAPQPEPPTTKLKPPPKPRNPTPAGFGEASTLIRQDPTTRPGLGNEWAEAETVIRPGESAGELAERPTLASEKGLPAPPPPREASRTRIVQRTPPQVHAVYLSLAFATLVAGFAFGFFAGNTSAPAAVPAKAQPTVEVIVPDSAVVTLDGVALTGQSPRRGKLQPGKPTRLHVEVPGAQAVETELVLDYNQIRIFEFTTAPLTPTK